MATIGYAWVSLGEQTPDLQLDALRAAGAERIYVDQATGATMSRPELAKAMADVNAGDVLLVWRLERLGRSVGDLVAQVDDLGRRGVEFRSITEAIDTTSAGGRLVFHIFAAMAEFERALIIERTRAGLAAAKARGRPIGRPRLVTPERGKTARELRDQGMKLRAIAKHMRISEATVVRLLALVKDNSEG